MSSLCEKLGGEAAIDLAVEKFYDKVINDQRIKHFFANIDMQKQKAHQKNFLIYALGDVEQFTGRGMRQAHEDLVNNMGLSDVHFDAIAENLIETLEDLQVLPELIDQVVEIVGSVQHRNDVLNR